MNYLQCLPCDDNSVWDRANPAGSGQKGDNSVGCVKSFQSVRILLQHAIYPSSKCYLLAVGKLLEIE